MPETKHLHVIVDSATPIPDLQKLIPDVRPSWRADDVQFQISPKGAAAGCINTMVIAFVNQTKQNAVMFRVYGAKELEEFFNRKLEVFHINLINDMFGFAPNVLLSFENGFCYDYIHGEVMKPRDMMVDANWKIIARQIALLHSIEVEEEFREKSKTFDFMAQAPDLYPAELKNPLQNKIFQEELPSKEYIQKEIKLVLEAIKNNDSKICLCHNDLRAENMVCNKDEGTITFVDFELTSFGRQAGDIAYHFWRFTGVENNDYSLYPGKDFQMAWLRLYLETYNQKTTGSDRVSENEIERLYIQVNVYYLLLLMQAMCAVAYVDKFDTTSIPIDIFSAAVPSYNEYRKVKDGILALKMPDQD